MNAKLLGKVGIVQDERASRERARAVARMADVLRRFAYVDLLRADSREEEVLNRLKHESYRLLLAPWHKYLHWQKIEGALGLTRTGGPNFAGYFSEPVPYEELGEASRPGNRALLLDLAHLEAAESVRLLLALGRDETRSGIRPLHGQDTKIYCENWYGGQPGGARADIVASLPEVIEHWGPRVNAIRVCMLALWSVIFEEGPGKSELANSNSAPKAYFQLGADAQALTLRLCFSMPTWKPADALGAFWPTGQNSASPYSLLSRYADFVRVNLINESNTIELVAGFMPSAPALKTANSVHTFLIESLSAKHVTEEPFVLPGPQTPHLKLLPQVAISGAARPSDGSRTEQEKHKERLLREAAIKMKEMKAQLLEKEETIRDLKSGGVGTAAPLPPPDVEGILEAFQHKYFEAKQQIRQFEMAIAQLEANGGEKHEIEALNLKMKALVTKEKEWVRMIAETLTAFKKDQQPKRQAGG